MYLPRRSFLSLTCSGSSVSALAFVVGSSHATFLLSHSTPITQHYDHSKRPSCGTRIALATPRLAYTLTKHIISKKYFQIALALNMPPRTCKPAAAAKQAQEERSMVLRSLEMPPYDFRPLNTLSNNNARLSHQTKDRGPQQLRLRMEYNRVLPLNLAPRMLLDTLKKVLVSSRKSCRPTGRPQTT